jgi:hypothetical protein
LAVHIKSEKATFDEQLVRLERGGNAWVEPMRKWVFEVNSICEIVANRDFAAQKALLRKMFGSNLFLTHKTLAQNPEVATPKRLSEMGADSRFCLWQKLKETNEKIAISGDPSKFFPNLAAQKIFPSNLYWTNFIN